MKLKSYATYIASVQGRTEAWKNQMDDLAVDSMLAFSRYKQEHELAGRLSGQVDDLDFGTWTEVSALGAL